LSIAVFLMSLATFAPTRAQDKSKSKAQVGGATYQRVTDPVGQSTQETTKNDGTQQKSKPSATSGDGYVGSEVCITCHEDQNRRFKNTPMGRAVAKETLRSARKSRFQRTIRFPQDGPPWTPDRDPTITAPGPNLFALNGTNAATPYPMTVNRTHEVGFGSEIQAHQQPYTAA
jgi:hypothetical protein